MHGTSTTLQVAGIILNALTGLESPDSRGGLAGVSLGILWDELKDRVSHEEFSNAMREMAVSEQLTILAVFVDSSGMQKGGVMRNPKPRRDTVRVDVASIPKAWLFVPYFIAFDAERGYLPHGSDSMPTYMVSDFRICSAAHCPSSMTKLPTLFDVLYA
jgi:hypothetical protein